MHVRPFCASLCSWKNWGLNQCPESLWKLTWWTRSSSGLCSSTQLSRRPRRRVCSAHQSRARSQWTASHPRRLDGTQSRGTTSRCVCPLSLTTTLTVRIQVARWWNPIWRAVWTFVRFQVLSWDRSPSRHICCNMNSQQRTKSIEHYLWTLSRCSRILPLIDWQMSWMARAWPASVGLASNNFAIKLRNSTEYVVSIYSKALVTFCNAPNDLWQSTSNNLPKHFKSSHYDNRPY